MRLMTRSMRGLERIKSCSLGNPGKYTVIGRDDLSKGRNHSRIPSEIDEGGGPKPPLIAAGVDRINGHRHRGRKTVETGRNRNGLANYHWLTPILSAST